MRMDGVDPVGFDFLDDTALTSSSANSQTGASFLGGTEPQGDGLDKYRKMLKCGLPQGAVEQKMLQDGIDPKTASNNSAPKSTPSSSSASAGQGAPRTGTVPSSKPPALIKPLARPSSGPSLATSATPPRNVAQMPTILKRPIQQGSPSGSLKTTSHTQQPQAVWRLVWESYPIQSLFRSTLGPLCKVSDSPKSALLRSLLLMGTITTSLVLGFILRGHGFRPFSSLAARFMGFCAFAGLWVLVLLWQDYCISQRQGELIVKFPYSLMRNPFDPLAAVFLVLMLVVLTNRLEALIVGLLLQLAALHFFIIR